MHWLPLPELNAVQNQQEPLLRLNSNKLQSEEGYSITNSLEKHPSTLQVFH